MKPASTTSSTSSAVEPVAQRAVARLAVGVVGDREDRGVHPGAARALEAARLGAARGHAHHLHRAAPVHAVEQGLQVRALAGDQDGDAERHGQAAACAGSRSTGYGPPEVSIVPAGISSSTRARMSARRMCDDTP